MNSLMERFTWEVGESYEHIHTHFIPKSEFLISINRIIQQESYQENINKSLFRINHTLTKRKSKSIFFPVLNSKGQEWEVASKKMWC